MVNIASNIFLTLLFSLILNFCFAQEKSFDSLLKELNTGQNIDTILTEISQRSKLKEPLAKEFVELGLTFSIDKKLPEWEVVFLLDQAALLLNDSTSRSITNCLEALQLMIEHPNSNKYEWRAHFLLSMGLNKIGAYRHAIKHRKKHAQINIKRKPDNNTAYPEILTDIGILYLKIDENDTAITYFKKAYTRDTNNLNYINNLGLGFLNSGNIDSAKLYFTLGYKLLVAKGKENTAKFGYISGNLSQCYSYEGNEEKIQKLLDDDIRLSRKFGLLPSLANAYLAMSDLNSFQKKHITAKFYVDSAMAVTNEMNASKNHEIKLKVLKKYIHVFEKLNDSKSAIKYMDLYLSLYDSFYGIENNKQLIRNITAYRITGIQKELELKKSNLREKQEKIKALKKEEELSKLETTLITSIASFLLIIALFIIVKILSDVKKKRKINLLTKKVYESAIENQNERLTAATLSLARKKEFSEGLVDQISEIEGLDKRSLIPIKQYISTELQMDESILETEKYIAELSKDFFTIVKLKFPNLTENDLKMCGLIRLKLSIKQIAIIKHITPESVKISKNRLSKKLGLEAGTNLYEYLKQF